MVLTRAVRAAKPKLDHFKLGLVDVLQGVVPVNAPFPLEANTLQAKWDWENKIVNRLNIYY